MKLRKIAYIIPFGIIKKVAMRLNSYNAKLNDIPVKVFDIEYGVWLCISEKTVLLSKKRELEKELEKIQQRLNKY